MNNRFKPEVKLIGPGLYCLYLPGVSVDCEITLNQAVQTGAPDTDPEALIYWGARRYKEPTGKCGVVSVNISLLAIEDDTESLTPSRALQFANHRGLKIASLREIAAIGTTWPNLHFDRHSEPVPRSTYLQVVCLESFSAGGNAYPMLSYHGILHEKQTREMLVANDALHVGGPPCFFGVMGEVTS